MEYYHYLLRSTCLPTDSHLNPTESAVMYVFVHMRRSNRKQASFRRFSSEVDWKSKALGTHSSPVPSGYNGEIRRRYRNISLWPTWSPCSLGYTVNEPVRSLHRPMINAIHCDDVTWGQRLTDGIGAAKKKRTYRSDRYHINEAVYKMNIRVNVNYITFHVTCTVHVTWVARWLSGRASDLRWSREFEARPRRCCATTLGKLFTPYCLCHQAV